MLDKVYLNKLKEDFSKDTQSTMKDHTCWTKMINSINFFHKKNSQSKGPNSKLHSKQEKSDFKQSTKASEKENSNIKSKTIVTPVRESRVKQTLGQTLNQKKETENQNKKEESVMRPVQQEPGETERKFIQSQVEQSNRCHDEQSNQGPFEQSNEGQDEENSLPTEKSEIIMNDIGKDIDQNENNFLFEQNPDNVENFAQVYQKLKLIKTSVVYEQYLVKKKASNEIRRAYVMKGYETFIEEWGIEQEQAIEKYCELYEREKQHIKSWITLSKNNCRHLIKLLDYELQPPTINTNQNNKFTPGSVAVVFQAIDLTLSDYLTAQSNNLSRLDKKKIIYQICACMSDIHQNNLNIRDLSIDNLYIDKFRNIKFNSLQIQHFNAKFYHCEDIKNKTNLIYSTPEDLEAQVKSDRMAQNKTFFHSGFSQISDFDKTQFTPDKQDLWKLGIIITKIFTNKFIFNQLTPQQQKNKIKEILETKQNQSIPQSILKEKLSHLSPHEINTIESLLKINPNERLTCKELLASDYLTNILDDSYQQNQ